MIQNVRKVIEIQGIPLLPQRSEMVRATVPYFMRYFPVCILGPDLPGVWYRGRGHVWKSVEGLCSCMVQAMLEAVYAVWVCFWLQYVLK